MSWSQNRYLHCFALLVSVLAFYTYESLVSVSNVWLDSETFNHCFFVIPIAVYLALQEKHVWLKESPSFSWIGFIALFVCLFVWLFAYAGRIDGLMHLSVFSALPFLWLTLTGWKVSRKMWFPLIFVLFSVPMGEELIPIFQDITATISVKLLAISGVPVYREGLFIQIPEGRFLVAEACSGVRFFVSTVMLGALCSYLLFQSVYKRVLFLGFSIGLPIAANILRAYGTMVIGHTFGMEYAAGADHLIYGWFFFALVTVVLVLVGRAFRENHELGTEEQEGVLISDKWRTFSISAPQVSLMLVMMAFVAWKLSLSIVSNQQYQLNLETLKSIDTDKIEYSYWNSSFPEATKSHNSILQYSGDELSYRVHAYMNAGLDSELIAWKNRIYDPDQWTLEKQDVFYGAGWPILHQFIVSNKSTHRSVAYWYSVPGYQGASRVKTKLQQALNTMLGRGNDGAVIILSVKGSNIEENSDYLRHFIESHKQQLADIARW